MLDVRLLEWKDLQESRGQRVIQQRAPLVGVTVVVMDSREIDKPIHQRTVHIGRFDGLYSGTDDPERVKEELTDQIKALISRAPLRENFKGPYILGVPHDIQYKAVCDMASHWHDPSLHSDYAAQLRYLFDHFLKEHVEPDTEIEAYDLFRKSVERSYGNLARFKRGSEEKPRLRKRKNT
jgi:hypothetical protein